MKQLVSRTRKCLGTEIGDKCGESVWVELGSVCSFERQTVVEEEWER